MAKIAAVASEYLEPASSKSDSAASHMFELTNPKTSLLIDLPRGTYFISKDDRKLLEEHSLLGDIPLEDSMGMANVSATSVLSGAVDIETADSSSAAAEDNKLSISKATSDLCEELEEATSHLPAPVTAESGSSSAAQDNELMQVDEIVNQVVGATTQQTLNTAT